jgi:hypothetical protein
MSDKTVTTEKREFDPDLLARTSLKLALEIATNKLDVCKGAEAIVNLFYDFHEMSNVR